MERPCRHRLRGTFPSPFFFSLFLLSSIFLLPLPLASSLPLISSQATHDLWPRHIQEGARPVETQWIRTKYSRYFSVTRNFLASRKSRTITTQSRACHVDEYLNISPTVQEARSRSRELALVKKYFDSAISTVVVVVYAREIIYIETRLIWISGELKGAVCVCRGTCQKDCGNARPGKS